MSFFSKFFTPRETKTEQPTLRFGRYTDVYKNEVQLDHWDHAISFFEAENYLASYRTFFQYLTDESQGNVLVEEHDGRINFEFYQGSKKIVGYASADKLKAESKIARTNDLNIGFMRRLIENNYNLKYGRYCIDPQGDISIVFDTLSLDASPHKIYYALKEIALASDKQDDLLVEEFSVLDRVNVAHIQQLPAEEKDIKIKYLRDEITKTLEEVRHGRLKAHQYPGGITYLLLELIYRLDFLVRPEGATMEAFERMHRLYFAADKSSARDKNGKLIKEFEGILKRSDERFAEELYNTVSTFGITNPSTHAQLKEFILAELDNMDWYLENKYRAAALAIPNYIVGYSLFYYSLTQPDRDFFLLYMQIMQQSFFTSLGYQLSFADEGLDGKLYQDEIVSAIYAIGKEHQPSYPYLSLEAKDLKFEDKASFAKSYLQMVAELDLTTSSEP